jgi:F0F1-type ATP synthase assembly protein I
VNDVRTLRRWIGLGIFLLVIAVAGWIVPRLGARSPLLFIVLPVLGILTMKLVERRVSQWFRRWAAKQAVRSRGGRP